MTATPAPVHGPISSPANAPPSGSRASGSAYRYAGAALLIPSVLSFLGALTTAEYNAVLGRAGAFGAETLLQYVVLGAKSLVLPAVQLCVAATTWACLVLLWHTARAGVPGLEWQVRRASVLTRRHLARVGMCDRDTCGRVLCVCCLVLTVLVLRSFDPLVSSLTASIDDAPTQVFAPLSSELDDTRGWFMILLVAIMLLLVTGGLSLGLPSGFRRGTTLGMSATAVLLLVLIVAPWRTMYAPKMRVALYGSQRCFVIGEHQAEYLLHCPSLPAPRNRVVAQHDRQLVFTSETAYLFDAYAPAMSAANR